MLSKFKWFNFTFESLNPQKDTVDWPRKHWVSFIKVQQCFPSNSRTWIHKEGERLNVTCEPITWSEDNNVLLSSAQKKSPTGGKSQISHQGTKRAVSLKRSLPLCIHNDGCLRAFLKSIWTLRAAQGAFTTDSHDALWRLALPFVSKKPRCPQWGIPVSGSLLLSRRVRRMCWEWLCEVDQHGTKAARCSTTHRDSAWIRTFLIWLSNRLF